MLNEIDALFNARKNKEALVLLRQYVSEHGDNANQAYRLAVVEEEIGDKDLADKAYMHCLKMIANNVQVYLYAGCFYLKQSQFDKAVSILSLGNDLDERLTRFQFDDNADYDTRVRSYNADMALRHHFTSMHQKQIAAHNNIPFVKNSIWPQTHHSKFEFRYKEQLPHLFYLPDLEAQPIWENEQFDWTNIVANEFTSLKNEFLNLDKHVINDYVPYLDESYSNKGFEKLAGQSNWSALHLFKDGIANRALLEKLPVTEALLKQLPLYSLDEEPYEVFFSVLKPGQHITPHFGLSNHSLTVHLPIIIPGDGYLKVGNKIHTWQEGKTVIFDDSFEHEATNTSSHDRVVLIFSIWHPSLNANEQQVIKQTFNAREKWLSKRTSYLPSG